MEFLKVIKERYSCKKYDGRSVEREKLNAILNAGRLAPTAKNLQEQRIYVIEGDENLKKVDSITPCRYNAGTCLLVAFNKDTVFTYPNSDRNSGIEDATIVATHMILAAANEGVNSCWVNCLDIDKAKELFNLPDNEEVLMIMDLGYAAADAEMNPNHNKRKDLKETVVYL